MAKLPKRLSKSVIDALVAQPGQAQTFYWDPELTGFGVRVSAQGAKSFVVKRRGLRVVVERADVISVDEARQRAMELLASIGRGANPVRARRAREDAEATARRADLTVREVWAEYCKAKKQLRAKTLREYEYALTTYGGKWLDKPLRSLGRSFISEEHTRIREDVARNRRSRMATGNSTANGVMRVVRALWNFAADHELVPDLGRNPVLALSRDRAWYPETPRENYIPEAQLPAFYAAIHGYRSSHLVDEWAYRDLVRLMLFTGLRLGEASGLRWENIDLSGKVLRLAAEQTKARRRLDLPMSDYVEALFNARARSGPWVFPGLDGPVTNPRNALLFVAKALARSRGEPDPRAFYFNPHSLRRTFVTVAESCDLSTYTLKALVNHSFGGDVTASYIGRDVERLRSAAQRVTDRMCELVRPRLQLLAV